MKALILGITGQDGSYLTDLLLDKDYEVLGVIRRSSNYQKEIGNLQNINHPKLHLEYGDITDPTSLERHFALFKPHEVYNLAAQSHVKISFDNPVYTAQVTGLAVVSLLELFKQHIPYSRFYQASSSEMFGNNIDEDGFQRETTSFQPVSPYGCAKLFAHNMCINYRKSYGLFISCGILFNHESPRRGLNFVTSKIAKGAVDISRSGKRKLELGNLDSYRDWGHAKDYVNGMWLMLQHKHPDDFVLATGENHSIRELCNIAFRSVGLNYKNYVIKNPKFMRPQEVYKLKGDASKAQKLLGWAPSYTFNELVMEMVDYWYEKKDS